MTITGQSSLDRDTIQQMVRDAEAHADEDRRRRDEAEARNNADTLVYQTEKLMREQGDKVLGDDKDAVESALADLKSALGGTEVEPIKTATERLMSASQTFTQKLYEAASAADREYQQNPGAGGSSSTPPNDDDVVDAEIVDEDKSA
jgi:molecular chaperone DnaK